MLWLGWRISSIPNGAHFSWVTQGGFCKNDFWFSWTILTVSSLWPIIWWTKNETFSPRYSPPTVDLLRTKRHCILDIGWYWYICFLRNRSWNSSNSVSAPHLFSTSSSGHLITNLTWSWKSFQLFQPYHARYLGATRPRLLVNSAGLGRRLRPLRHQLDQACVRQDGAPGFAKLLDNCKDHSVWSL